MPNSQFVPFPAVRPSNFSDEVDIETPAGVTFKAKNRDGAVETVTLAEFLRRIGHFIADLPRDTDWSDSATDSGPMQSTSHVPLSQHHLREELQQGALPQPQPQ